MGLFPNIPQIHCFPLTVLRLAASSTPLDSLSLQTYRPGCLVRLQTWTGLLNRLYLPPLQQPVPLIRHLLNGIANISKCNSCRLDIIYPLLTTPTHTYPHTLQKLLPLRYQQTIICALIAAQSKCNSDTSPHAAPICAQTTAAFFTSISNLVNSSACSLITANWQAQVAQLLNSYGVTGSTASSCLLGVDKEASTCGKSLARRHSTQIPSPRSTHSSLTTYSYSLIFRFQ